MSMTGRRASTLKQISAGLLGLAAILCACASLETSPPTPEASAIETERRLQVQAAIDERLELTRRVQRLAWPLLTKSTDLCGGDVKPTLGLRFADAAALADAIKGLREQDVRFAGYDDRVRVIAAPKNAPAGAAGVVAGDELLSVNGEPLPDRQRLKAIAKAFDVALETDDAADAPPVRLGLRRGDQLLDIEISPEPACRTDLALGSTPTINASAGFRTITVHAGLARAVDDRQLQFVIAHELGHRLMRHPQKGTRASLLSGRAALGFVGGVVGGVADVGLSLIGRRPEIPLGVRGAALAVYPFGEGFEREADYWAVYLIARAGGDLTEVEDVYATFATLSPTSSWARIIHPPTPERAVAVREAVAEVRAKAAAGAPLLPEGYARPAGD